MSLEMVLGYFDPVMLYLVLFCMIQINNFRGDLTAPLEQQLYSVDRFAAFEPIIGDFVFKLK